MSSVRNALILLGPPWLVEIHNELWGKRDLFGKIFRTATLTKSDFTELQCLLDALNPKRNSDQYEAEDVLATKSAFLRERSTGLDLDLGNGLVPRPVLDSPRPPSSDIVLDDDDDDDAAMMIDSDHCSGDTYIPNEVMAIFPYTIQYVDLTVLQSKKELRVPRLMLFRNEWGTMIDIFNKRKKGIRGSALFSGQPGIGEHHYWYLTVTSNQRTRENMHVVFHPHSLHYSCPANRVSGCVRQCLHYW